MALTFQPGSPELNYNTAVLPPPCQRGQHISLCKRPAHEKTQAGTNQDKCEQESS